MLHFAIWWHIWSGEDVIDGGDGSDTLDFSARNNSITVTLNGSDVAVLKDELANDIHALALHTYLPKEWQDLNSNSPESPNCMGGSKL